MFNWLNEIQFRQIIGRFKLTFSELEEILLDRQINLNNRPLTYFEDDIQLEPHSQVCDNFWQLKAFKNDKKCFLFNFKSSFCSQDV